MSLWSVNMQLFYKTLPVTTEWVNSILGWLLLKPQGVRKALLQSELVQLIDWFYITQTTGYLEGWKKPLSLEMHYVCIFSQLILLSSEPVQNTSCKLWLSCCLKKGANSCVCWVCSLLLSTVLHHLFVRVWAPPPNILLKPISTAWNMFIWSSSSYIYL